MHKFFKPNFGDLLLFIAGVITGLTPTYFSSLASKLLVLVGVLVIVWWAYKVREIAKAKEV